MSTSNHSLKLVLSPERIQRRVAELAADISREYQGRDLAVLGVLKGAFIFMGDLVRCLDMQVEMDFVRLSSYGASTESSGRIRMTKEPEIDLSGRPVVVVEDIVDTGLTLNWLVDRLRGQGAVEVRTCSLIDKPERRQAPVQLDYVGFDIPSGFLVGYGLDYNEQYRHLPGVYEVLFTD